MFDPDPGTQMHLPQPDVSSGTGGGERAGHDASYTFQSSPAAPQFAYQSEGGKAIVYRLQRDHDKSIWALKVFKKTFRASSIRDACDRLTSFSTIKGLQAARRTVLMPDHPAVRACPDLEWTVVMPWVRGRTWFEMIARSLQDGAGLSGPDYGMMARQFMLVMADLEKRGLVHTDISSGNVCIEMMPASVDIQLIDLEDMWQPGMRMISNYTAGYGHPSLAHGATTSCLEGDRYSAVILAAEMLALSDLTLRYLATPDGYFRGSHKDADAHDRYEKLRKRTLVFAPDFAEVFEQAWHSHTLDECPTLQTVCETLTRRRVYLDRVPVAPPGPRITVPPLPAKPRAWKRRSLIAPDTFDAVFNSEVTLL